MIKCQNDEKHHWCSGCHRCSCILNPAVKPLMQLPSRRLWLCPSQFSSWKIPYSSPKAGFCRTTKKQTLPVPHSRTFNGSKGVKTIHQPSCLPNMAAADIFLFQRDKVEAGRPFPVPGQPHDKHGGVPESAAKTSPPLPFRGRRTL